MADWDRRNLARLPRTRDEVNYIVSLIPKDRTRLYLGQDSTEKAFKQEPLNKYRWIHFATHSLINERHPGRSAVVLALDGNNNEDGFLRATEIAELNLNCDMVILSACETGIGKEIRGEGLIALTRGFMYAGAARVVASLWKVNDRATADLMAEFYREMLLNKTTPAAALRAAQLKLSQHPRWQNPHFWAGFVLEGEWR